MFKLLGFFLMFISWFWLSREWDFQLFGYFLLGFAIAFGQEIITLCVAIYRDEKLKIGKRK
jgi:hypothetical protein